MNGDTEISRVSKFFIDRDEMRADEALARRRAFAVTLTCGPDVAESYVLQLAVMTAARLANRCFPGAVRVALDRALAEAPLRLWPALGIRFGEALAQTATLIKPEDHAEGTPVLLFGAAPMSKAALRVTFDGWVAKTGPAATLERLPERQYCSLPGVLAAALAVSELFFSFAEISIEATRRTVALSLWRPDLDASHADALGGPIEVLPGDMWMLGLGHLGNAYLWSMGTLPYANPSALEIMLNDFDHIIEENVDTGILFTGGDVGKYKTRACAAWLEARGFRTRIVERPLDEHFRCRRDEPQLALCGFDSNPARRHLATAEFLRVVESGLGGSAENFDTVSLHTLPNVRQPEELWPDVDPAEREKQHAQRTRVANENPAYLALAADECGRYSLAGRSVAVPFVGAVASTLVVAEVLRLLHGGPSYASLKLGLAASGGGLNRPVGTYSAQDFAGLTYCERRQL